MRPAGAAALDPKHRFCCPEYAIIRRGESSGSLTWICDSCAEQRRTPPGATLGARPDLFGPSAVSPDWPAALRARGGPGVGAPAAAWLATPKPKSTCGRPRPSSRRCSSASAGTRPRRSGAAPGARGRTRRAGQPVGGAAPPDCSSAAVCSHHRQRSNRVWSLWPDHPRGRGSPPTGAS